MADGPVVIAADGSPASLEAVGRGLDLARRLALDAHVVVVTHLSPMFQVGMGAAMPPSVMNPNLEAEMAAAMWSTIDPVLASDGGGVDVTRVDLRGYPADKIAAYADEVDATLVVLGNRGFGPFRSALLGSTSHRVAQTCEHDVLIVRADED